MVKYPLGKNIAVLLVASAFLTYLTEIIHSRSFILSIDKGGFLTSVFLTFVAIFIIYSVFGRLWVSFSIVFMLLFVLSCVSYFKFAARGEPLYQNDLALAFKIARVTDSSNIVITKYIVFSAITGVCAVAGLFFFRLPPPSLKVRLVCGAVSVSVMLSIGGGSSRSAELDYSDTGFISGFFLSGKNALYADDFDSDLYDEIQFEVEEFISNPPVKRKTPEITPNVIVILSESFWDITQLEKLSFSEEPIPNFKSISGEAVSGNMISNTFGGGTINVEYEVLTGCLKRFLNEMETDFASMVKSETLSLASIFKQIGYEAIGLHTYERAFYNRDKAYPLLGFDEWIGVEDIEGCVYNGKYVSDLTLTDEIIKILEYGDSPKFIFAVSMENHQPYTKDKYADTKIKVLNDDMPASLKASVESYVHGLHSADRQLGRLVEYLKVLDTPATLMFFGDHQPTLGPERGLHRYAESIEDSGGLTLKDYETLFNTPFLIWSNYKNETIGMDAIGSNFLGNYLLDYLNMPKPLFYYFIDEVFENSFHFLGRKEMHIDSNNVRVKPDTMSEELMRSLEMYGTFQKYYLSSDDPVGEVLRRLY